MDSTRTHDLLELENFLKYEKDPQAREQIKKSIYFIKNETSAVRSMRQKLVLAHRNQDWDEVKDIQDWVIHHTSYQNIS
jgi:hypothetical protein